MRRQLTSDEVQYLFDLVRDREVKYIDVQHELVDHVASAVEEEMALNNTWTFVQALNVVLGRFPITGFAYFIQEKEKAMKAYWRSRQWAHLKTYFTFPKIMMTLATFASLWTILFWAPMILSAVLYIGVFLMSTWAIADHDNDPSSSKRSYLIWEPLLVIVPGVILLLTEVSMIFRLTGALMLLQGLIFFLVRFRSVHDFDSKRSLLVLSSFYRSFWIAGPVSLIVPLLGTDGKWFDMMQGSMVCSGLSAIVCTMVVVYIHAMVTHFKPMLRQELQQKYPHLRIAS
jgi:hypothetical protein